MRELKRTREVGLPVLWHMLRCKLMWSQRKSDAPMPPSFMTDFSAFAFLHERKLRQRLYVQLLQDRVNGE